jgi:hypothetical protein
MTPYFISFKVPHKLIKYHKTVDWKATKMTNLSFFLWFWLLKIIFLLILLISSRTYVRYEILIAITMSILVFVTSCEDTGTNLWAWRMVSEFPRGEGNGSYNGRLPWSLKT